MNLGHLITSTVAILIAAYLLPGVSTTLIGAIVFAVVLGLINVFIKPIVELLALPLTILTLGLFSLVINVLLVWGASELVTEFYISGFWSALFFSIIVSLINALFLPKGARD